MESTAKRIFGKALWELVMSFEAEIHVGRSDVCLFEIMQHPFIF